MKTLFVLLAALLLALPVQAGDCGAEATTADIVDTAVEAGSFTTLVKAVQAAGLVETLKGEGPFTVFAPTDEAFAKIPAETLHGLLQDKAALTKVLTYHVVAGEVPARAVTSIKWAPTVQGQSARIQIDGDQVMIDGARVVTTDIHASNGIIHVIDAVILPKS